MEFFVPKPKRSESEEQRFRPIVFSEILLNIMEKALLPELTRKVELEEEQFMNKPNGGLRAKFMLMELQTLGNKDIVKLDLKNAFNNLPHSEIRRAMI